MCKKVIFQKRRALLSKQEWYFKGKDGNEKNQKKSNYRRGFGLRLIKAVRGDQGRCNAHWEDGGYSGENNSVKLP